MLARARYWLTNLGLQRRVQLLTVVGLLGVFVFFWLAGQRALQASTRQSLDSQLALARLVAGLLEYRISSALAILEDVAAQPELSLADPAHPPTDTLHATQLQLNTYGRHLYWLDTAGTVLWAEPPEPALVWQPFARFPAVRRAVDAGAAYVSDLMYDSRTMQPYVLLAVPIKTPTGAVGGLLVEKAGTDLLNLDQILTQVVPAGVHVDVVDHTGTVLASSQPELRYRKGDHTDQFTTLIDNQQPLVGTCHRCHSGEDSKRPRQVEEILTFAPLSVAPWGVAVRQLSSEAMAPVSELRRQLVLGGSAALVITLLASWWFVTCQILRPIRAADEASRQLAAGNLEVPVPRGGVDEVARLTAHLEQMRLRLEATLADHRRWNEALEEMVEERTRELAALYEQLQDKEAMRKRLLAKVLTAQEEERKRLARELHDAIGQSLSAIIMTTTAVENSLPAEFTSGREKLASVRAIAAQALHDLRNLIFDLRPEVLDDLGLTLALRSQVKKYLEPAGVRVRLNASSLKGPLPAEIETAVFRVVQEAITNIARHARATEASITLERRDNRLVVRVEDNGIGFDLAATMRAERKGWGLRGMEERITLLGGRFYIGSRPGQGTLVLAEVPLEEARDHHAQDTSLDRG